MNWRLHGNKRQRNKLGKAARPGLKVAKLQQMPRPMPIVIDVAKHDRGRRPDTEAVRGLDDFEPLRSVDFVRTDDGAYFVVQDLCRRAGQRA